jgi:uncharacterized protein involved in exopolysaccharide biosynthesis
MDDSKTFFDYWLVIYRNRAIVLITLASAMTTAWLASEIRDPIYQAQTVFFVPNPVAATSSSFFAGPELPARGPALPVTNREQERAYLAILESEAIRNIVAEEAPGKSAARLDRDADVEITRNHTVEVRVWDRDPDLAAQVANAYPVAMQRFLWSLSSEKRERDLEAMGDVLTDAEAELDVARQELLDFLLEQGTPDVGQESLALVQRRQQLEDQVRAVQTELDALDQRLPEAEDRFRREAAIWGGGEAADEGEIDRLIRDGVAPRGARNSYYEQLRREVASLRIERVTLEERLNSQRAALAELDERAGVSPRQRLKEEELRTAVGRLQQMVETLAVRAAEGRAQAASENQVVSVLQHAVPPEKPAFPLAIVDTLIAAPLGLLAGIYLAFLYDYILRVQRLRREEVGAT